jgi:hypothetical protein
MFSVCRSRQLAIQKEQREKEQARRKAEEAVLAMKKARKETWNMKDKVLQKLAKDAEDRRTTAEKAKEELEERIRSALPPLSLPATLENSKTPLQPLSCVVGVARG